LSGDRRFRDRRSLTKDQDEQQVDEEEQGEEQGEEQRGTKRPLDDDSVQSSNKRIATMEGYLIGPGEWESTLKGTERYSVQGKNISEILMDKRKEMIAKRSGKDHDDFL